MKIYIIVFRNLYNPSNMTSFNKLIQIFNEMWSENDLETNCFKIKIPNKGNDWEMLIIFVYMCKLRNFSAKRKTEYKLTFTAVIHVWNKSSHLTKQKWKCISGNTADTCSIT